MKNANKSPRKASFTIDGYTDVQSALFRAHDHQVPAIFLSRRMWDKFDNEGKIEIVFPENMILAEFKRLKSKMQREKKKSSDAPIFHHTYYQAQLDLIDEMIKFFQHKAYKPSKK